MGIFSVDLLIFTFVCTFEEMIFAIRESHSDWLRVTMLVLVVCSAIGSQAASTPDNVVAENNRESLAVGDEGEVLFGKSAPSTDAATDSNEGSRVKRSSKWGIPITIGAGRSTCSARCYNLGCDTYQWHASTCYRGRCMPGYHFCHCHDC